MKITLYAKNKINPAEKRIVAHTEFEATTLGVLRDTCITFRSNFEGSFDTYTIDDLDHFNSKCLMNILDTL
ncbi:hypothetical protein [Candidatus Lokiarchaeum ossiferum]|uniref:hypothetical protein n=1 Tax=Candidatus Lokiarchaeum ossiferum TaxID=2951803 RepID=UPI00352C675E